MNRIEKYIPQIITILKRDYGEKVPKIYNSYIASFSTSIAMNGLIATVALYEDMNKIKENKTKGDRSYIPKLIMEILTQREESLLRYILENKEAEKVLKRQILDISIAFKLAIRTFKLEG